MNEELQEDINYFFSERTRKIAYEYEITQDSKNLSIEINRLRSVLEEEISMVSKKKLGKLLDLINLRESSSNIHIYTNALREAKHITILFD